MRTARAAAAHSAPTFSNHSVLLRAAFCSRSTSMRRSPSYAGERFSDCRFFGTKRAASAIASSMASFVPRPDRKVRRVRRVSEQHDVFMRPMRVAHAREIEPVAPAQVRGIGHQSVPLQIWREQRLRRTRWFAARSGLVQARARARFLRGTPRSTCCVSLSKR